MIQRAPAGRVWPRFAAAFPLALALAGGCVATRGDLRVLQGDLATLRTELARNHQAQQDAAVRLLQQLGVVGDSLARLSARTVAMQGDQRGDMRAVREQILQVQTLLGQSTATIARLRAEIEEARAAAPVWMAVPPSDPAATGEASADRGGDKAPDKGSDRGGDRGAGRDPGRSGEGGGRADRASADKGGAGKGRPAGREDSAAAPPAPRVPGPNQLFTAGRDQLTRGSTATARTLFQELLVTYPDHDLAGEAQYWIAETLAKEKKGAAADAAYAAVVATYPDSRMAPNALYKRAQLAVGEGSVPQARQLLQQVIARYPRSDEAALAAEQLKTLR
ncbi:MAG: tol-pal system protein YbgF [Gemmatimonadetes bacterium]|nr:tol-pal system protein YbgF [Gemmatimonadota bacterium]